MRTVPTAIALFVPLAVGSAQELENPSFEKKGSPPPGWSVSVGATNGNGAESRITVKTGEASQGRSALKLAGDSSTAKWRMVYQDVPVEPTQRVTLTVAMKAKKVVREGPQFHNAYAAVSFFEGEEHLKTIFGPTLKGDVEWGDVTVQGIAPDKADTARVKFFLSMSGTLWVDDVRLAIAPTQPLDKAARESAFDALAHHMTVSYPFWGIEGKPKKPDKFFKGHRAKAVKAKDLEKFLAVLEKMLDELADNHISMSTPNGKVYTGPRNPYPANYNYKAVEEHFAEKIASTDGYLIAKLKEGPGYVRIHSFSQPDEVWTALDKEMDRLKDAPSLVIDVRSNGGGDDSKASFIAGRFVEEKTPFAPYLERDVTQPKKIAFGEPIMRHVFPREGREPDLRPVVLLQGRHCASSTEAFCLMMKAIPTVTTVGMPSKGSSGRPRGFDLLPGVTIYLSSWRSLEMDETCIEVLGVQPQVEVDERPAKYLKGDPTFEKGLEVLGASG